MFFPVGPEMREVLLQRLRGLTAKGGWGGGLITEFSMMRTSESNHQKSYIFHSKINMEPENAGVQKGISFSRGPFSGFMLIFRGVI